MPYTSKFVDTLYNKKWLEKMNRTMSVPEIAEHLGCTRGAVHDNLRKFGISLKGHPRRAVGSHTARPRKRFLSTLHNVDWLTEHYVEQKKSASEIAFLAGSSIPSAIRALKVAGIKVRGIGEAKQGVPVPARKVSTNMAKTNTMRQRARRKMPPGRCVICGKPGLNINHKDRNPHNEDDANLERLCVACHGRQHAMEERVMIEWLATRGVAYREIHEEARARFLRDGFISLSEASERVACRADA